MNQHPMSLSLNLPFQTTTPSTTSNMINILHQANYSSPSNNKRSPPPFFLNPPTKRHCSHPYQINPVTSKFEFESPSPSYASFHENPNPTLSLTAIQNPIQTYPIPNDLDTPTTPVNPQHDPSPPPSPSPNQAPVAEKFAKSRATGQDHRDNEREHIKDLERKMERARDENSLLFSIVKHQFKRQRFPNGISSSEIALPCDVAEDYDVFDDDTAFSRGLLTMSSESQRRLGIKYISPAIANILLEFIILRRNWVYEEDNCTSLPLQSNLDSPTNTNRRKRRRTKYLKVPFISTIEKLVSHSANVFAAEVDIEQDVDQHVDFRLGNLSVVLHRWIESERKHGGSLDCEDFGLDEVTDPPKSPTRPSAADFGSPPQRRRGEGVKKCSRCGVKKFSGSGHGRSTCADGHSISSPLPFPTYKKADEITAG